MLCDDGVYASISPTYIYLLQNPTGIESGRFRCLKKNRQKSLVWVHCTTTVGKREKKGWWAIKEVTQSVMYVKLETSKQKGTHPCEERMVVRKEAASKQKQQVGMRKAAAETG